MSNNIPTTPSVSEYIQTKYPLFKEFVKVYYEFANKKDNAVGYVKTASAANDIDLTDDDNLNLFYKTYGHLLPSSVAFDKRNLIKILNTVYSAKGTENALLLLFKLVFNETPIVSYPGTQILRASDGKWNQDTFITLVHEPTIIRLPVVNDTLRIITSNYIHNVKISKIIEIDEATTRFYFKPYNVINFQVGQVVYGLNEAYETIYSGNLIESPSKLIITDPGESWQRGQVITIPGTIKDTIARVTTINSVGGITNLEIIDHGYNHTNDQLVVVSPFLNKPAGASVDIIVNVGVGFVDYIVNILDYTDGISELVEGNSTAPNATSYFSQNYTSGDYTLNVVLKTEWTSTNTSSNIDDTLTMEKWLRSRASLIYKSATSTKTRGYFSDDSGQLSNVVSRLQDNYLYQPFSYLIESRKDIKEYESLAFIYHPAGTKGFSSLAKATEANFNYSAERTLSFETIYLRDVSTAFDTSVKILDKNIEETATIAESIAKPMIKYLSDDEVFVGEADIFYVDNSKYATNYFSTEDYIMNEFILTIG